MTSYRYPEQLYSILARDSTYLASAKIKIIGVQQELWMVVKLWDELFDVAAVVQHIGPGVSNAVE